MAKNTEIYNIDGFNYFKLRDIAALLNGTGSQFSTDFDSARNTIVVKTGAAYTQQAGKERNENHISGQSKIIPSDIIFGR